VDFVAVVDQAIALLRQRGRLTYRTLQLQFQFDAEHLAVLTDELIEGVSQVWMRCEMHHLNSWRSHT
jgi:hypothetical protein